MPDPRPLTSTEWLLAHTAVAVHLPHLRDLAALLKAHHHAADLAATDEGETKMGTAHHARQEGRRARTGGTWDEFPTTGGADA